MSSFNDQNKTEAPTQRRRDEARKKGQVARSADLSGTISLLAILLVFWLGARHFSSSLLIAMRRSLSQLSDADGHTIDVLKVFYEPIKHLSQVLLPILACSVLVALAVGFFQSGISFSTHPLRPDVKRLSPASGLRRIFGTSSIARGSLDVLRLIVVVLLVVWSASPHLEKLRSAHFTSAIQVVTFGWNAFMSIAFKMTAAFFVLAVADFAFQRWRHEQSLRMSREDLKSELKDDEGDPLIRSRIKALQRESRKRRMLSKVPEATVIITNPTHIAVALKYEQGKTAAPIVVAKGANHLAKRITGIGRDHHIPIVEKKPLARAIYETVDVDQTIPVALYRAVAEIIAYVFELRKPSNGSWESPSP